MPDATEKIQLTRVNGSDTQLLHAPLPGPVSLTGKFEITAKRPVIGSFMWNFTGNVALYIGHTSVPATSPKEQVACSIPRFARHV